MKRLRGSSSMDKQAIRFHPILLFLFDLSPFFLVNRNHMAMAPICFKMCYKHRTVNNDQEVIGGISSVSNHKLKNTNLCYNSVATFKKTNKTMLKCSNFSRYISPNASEREKPLVSSSREKQLRSLDSYFKKFKNDMNHKDSHNISPRSEPTIYPVKNRQETQTKVDSKSDSDETSGLYMICTMVTLWSKDQSLDLIWRMVEAVDTNVSGTRLTNYWHTGILHIGLGCWALLTFGPKVCRAYGPFTFFLIYILGGLSGNLTSFLHTPDPTVGGTGPVFAIIGAWLIYQYQNKDAIEKNVLESMYQKAIFATALGFVLSIYGPIDDWTHFGSVFTGIAYGFMTCPTLLQIDDSSSSSSSSSSSLDTGKDNGMTLISRNVDPCKSLVMFSIFVLVLSCLVFVFEPPLGSLDVDTLV
ncbi:unnamed protein product [Lactuca virosa]|uniref:Peptidase S54 rhomboid domain-containing protein n=1 Tax=Lactuca virosa TaxID=75947 RepID=A0AAU9NHR1_9ASTR|nr:unnamed protein product [Lactuca virosa]